MNIPKTADIIIIGGGVMGASTAYHLAASGVKNVLLLEKEDFFGQGATGRCAGGVRYQFATEINIRLSLESLPMLERFSQEFGQKINYRKYGYLFLLTKEDDINTFKKNVALQNQLGVHTEWLDGDEIRKRLPMMQLDDVLAGTNYPQDGVVDPNGVVMGYIDSARRLGVTALTGTMVNDIIVKGGKVSSVETSQGTFTSQVVVNAAGPWAGLVGQMAGLPIPITPLRRQWLTTTPIPEIPDEFPFVIDFTQSLYFHQEGDGLLTGMSNHHENPGFDQNVDHDWEVEHINVAIDRLPLLEKVGINSRLAGLYENTPDAHPIIGKTPIEGFYIVAGFSGHGFMHGPVSGKLMSEIILHGRSETLDISMLDLARFVKGRLIPEYNVV